MILRIASNIYCLMLPLTVIFYMACKEQREVVYQFNDTKGLNYGIKEHSLECVKELGNIPSFNCLDGKVVPVFDSDTQQQITNLNFDLTTKCDKPSLLWQDQLARFSGISPCAPYTRVGRSVPSSGYATEWVWSCRRYYARDINSAIFDDINMIGHNPDTGATCFFVSRINRAKPTKDNDNGINGTNVPVYGSDEGMKFWKTPQEMTNVSAVLGGSQPCTDCHDNDPFVHSPFIQQLNTQSQFVPSNTTGKYWVVGKAYFNTSAWQLRHLQSEKAEPCLECHRIGSRRTCGEFAEMAVGLKTHSFQTKAFTGRPWMPQLQDNWELTHNPADDIYLKAARHIKTCCSNSNTPDCNWVSMPK